jgi:hypothetical protein
VLTGAQAAVERRRDGDGGDSSRAVGGGAGWPEGGAHRFIGDGGIGEAVARR